MHRACRKELSMAKFTVELVQMDVPKGQKGYLARFAGKTLTENVQFTPSDNGMDTSILTDAGFGYVSAKLENGKVHRAWRTSKVAKYAKSQLFPQDDGGSEVKPGNEINSMQDNGGSLADQIKAATDLLASLQAQVQGGTPEPVKSNRPAKGSPEAKAAMAKARAARKTNGGSKNASEQNTTLVISKENTSLSIDDQITAAREAGDWDKVTALVDQKHS
jgi:hypothetical protein